MQELTRAIAMFAPTELSVVIEGETGSGKEVAARALHRLGRRAQKPLTVVDCGALQENLVESELFGHERGAFTGAVDARAGAFESADGGTIFLDEVGELPLALQPKLLRALEAREVRRLGANKSRTVDVRVIAATNRDLPAEVMAGRFRSDLFFRLSEVRLRVPPLRERADDLVPLAKAFAESAVPDATIGPEAMQVLRGRRWPGNVRELANVLRRAAITSKGRIGPEHLAPPDFAGHALGPAVHIDTFVPIGESRDALLGEFHRLYLEALCERFDGDLHAVADAAGIHLNSVHRLLRQTGVKAK
jgi:DNA-binding NtrC family response regulator